MFVRTTVTPFWVAVVLVTANVPVGVAGTISSILISNVLVWIRVGYALLIASTVILNVVAKLRFGVMWILMFVPLAIFVRLNPAPGFVLVLKVTP